MKIPHPEILHIGSQCFVVGLGRTLLLELMQLFQFCCISVVGNDVDVREGEHVRLAECAHCVVEKNRIALFELLFSFLGVAEWAQKANQEGDQNK